MGQSVWKAYRMSMRRRWALATEIYVVDRDGAALVIKHGSTFEGTRRKPP